MCSAVLERVRLLFVASLVFMVIAVTAFLGGSPAFASPEKRVAFVVGNGAYVAVPRLDNPPQDARAVAASLKRLGFQVIEGYDLDLASLRAKIAEFSAALPGAKAAMVYYAGHGVSVDDENFLLPTDIVVKSPADLDLNAISVSLLLKLMRRQDSVNIVILDACRDNPFTNELTQVASTRSIVADHGLSRIDSALARGALVAFATEPKSAALDGAPGENSPFAKALLRHIEDPGVSIDTVMNRVRTEVWETTRGRQTPWVSTSIIGEFMLNPAPPAPAQPPLAVMASLPPQPGIATVPLSVEQFAQENRLWSSAERSNTAEDYQAYLDMYPTGLYAQMARNRIARLTGQPGSVSAPSIGQAALSAEVGTMATEKALELDIKARREVQLRLHLLDLYSGPYTGTFANRTRAAIAAWQTRHDVQATSWLGPLQYAALREESEAQYQRALVADPGVLTRDIVKQPTPPRPIAVRTRQPHSQPEPDLIQQTGTFFNSLVAGIFGHHR